MSFETKLSWKRFVWRRCRTLAGGTCWKGSQLQRNLELVKMALVFGE